VRVHVCVCQRELVTQRERKCVCVCVGERKRVCMRMNARERERERERDRANAGLYMAREVLNSAETLETIAQRCDNKGISFSHIHIYFPFLANSQHTHELMWPRLSSGAES